MSNPAQKLIQRVANKFAPQTLVPPGHFYSPIVDPIELGRRRAFFFDRSATPADVDFNFDGQVATLRELLAQSRRMPFADESKPGLRYRYNNDAFAFGEGLLLGGMMLKHQPKRVIEFGCGYSSCAMLDVNEQLLGSQVDFTFVDPFPKLLRDLGGNLGKATVLESAAQDIDLARIDALEANDILFIDSTHVSKSGSDVNFHLFYVLPRLKPGVLIHFHDIFYPFEYPDRWVFEQNRSWNECYLLRAFLMNNRDYRIVLFNSYFAYNKVPDDILAAFPWEQRKFGSSLWLQKLA